MTNLPETPKTLADILAWLDATDSGLINPTPEQQAEVGALLAAKVDGTKDFIDELEYQAERLRVAAAQLAEGKRQVLARVDRLKSYMAHHMCEKAFQQIPGDVWKVRLTGSEAVETEVEPDAEYARLVPELVRVKYEWNKSALKKALESGDAEAAAIAKLVASKSVQFSVNKGKMS